MYEHPGTVQENFGAKVSCLRAWQIMSGRRLNDLLQVGCVQLMRGLGAVKLATLEGVGGMRVVSSEKSRRLLPAELLMLEESKGVQFKLGIGLQGSIKLLFKALSVPRLVVKGKALSGCGVRENPVKS